LASTKQAANIIADVFFVKKSFLDKHPEELKALVEGWLKGAAEINTNPEAKAEAVKILAAGLNQPEDFVENAINNTRLATYGDNVAFFALKSGTGTTGQYLYEDMTRKYRDVDLIKSTLPWREVASTTVLRSITDLNGPEQVAEGAIRFTKADARVATAEAFASKAVSVEFPTGSATLTEEAQLALDAQVVSTIKGFTGARIRVEGNTDNTGSEDVNERLSLARAKAVVNYIVNKFGYDPDRFLPVGNGSRNPLPGQDNSTAEGRKHNRRTDVQVITG
jgi:NitT/TauT family transport system substrate-binding protein